MGGHLIGMKRASGMIIALVIFYAICIKVCRICLWGLMGTNFESPSERTKERGILPLVNLYKNGAEWGASFYLIKISLKCTHYLSIY